MKAYILIMSLIVFGFKVQSQTLVDVTESTIKVGALGSGVFYYGFAQGDEMVFSFTETEGKEVNEFEIIELNGESKFKKGKITKLENKRIKIERTGIYKFMFSNSTISERNCKVKIQRIPDSKETMNFNSTVYWKSEMDTAYTTVKEKYLIKADTEIVSLIDQVTKLYSSSDPKRSKTSFNFILPDNTVSWSYYIGVGKEGKELYQQAVKQVSQQKTQNLKWTPELAPLVALAMGKNSGLNTLENGQKVDYCIGDEGNEALFNSRFSLNCYKKETVSSDHSRMLSPIKGAVCFGVSNNDPKQSVSILVKIVAVTLTEQWGVREVQKKYVAEKHEAYLKN